MAKSSDLHLQPLSLSSYYSTRSTPGWQLFPHTQQCVTQSNQSVQSQIPIMKAIPEAIFLKAQRDRWEANFNIFYLTQ